jgi:putative restriction endonuclease
MWLQQLLSIGAQEANFWQPRPALLRQEIGTPWIFKVRGSDRIAGYALFSYYSVMPVGVAWETFGTANGVASFAEMLARIRSLRHTDSAVDAVGCVVLSNLVILPRHGYIAAPSDWKQNTVRGQYYDMSVGDGARIWSQLTAVAPAPIMASPLLHVPAGYGKPAMYVPRRGQGAFRLMVMDAYERKCAVTGEKTLPALEAAHIRPFSDVQSHDVGNGLLLRSDVHKLYDQGYVTVTPDYRFRVSKRIKEQFNNGVIYYDLDDSPIRLPADKAQFPDAGSLEWHSSTIFRE